MHCAVHFYLSLNNYVCVSFRFSVFINHAPRTPLLFKCTHNCCSNSPAFPVPTVTRSSAERHIVGGSVVQEGGRFCRPGCPCLVARQRPPLVNPVSSLIKLQRKCLCKCAMTRLRCEKKQWLTSYILEESTCFSRPSRIYSRGCSSFRKRLGIPNGPTGGRCCATRLGHPCQLNNSLPGK